MQFDLEKVLESCKNPTLLEKIREECLYTESGHLVYWPEKVNGYLDEYHLILIAAVLHQTNKPWDAEIAASL